MTENNFMKNKNSIKYRNVRSFSRRAQNTHNLPIHHITQTYRRVSEGMKKYAFFCRAVEILCKIICR